MEGPSDVIYLRTWLQMYARAAELDQLEQGKHFQFQMYGGALLDSLCLQTSEDDPGKERQKLVEMFSFSRNAYVVMDSDAVKSADGTVFDKSNFTAAKQFIKTQIESLNAQGYKLGLWFAEGDTTLRTIEDYLDDESKAAVSPSLSKRIAAERRVASWSGKSLTDFAEVIPEIERLDNRIRSWQPGQ